MIRYALVWATLGTVVAILIIAALGGGHTGSTDDVALPPVRETELASAARRAGCRFRRARPGERLNPPVEGPLNDSAARPGVYERPPRADSLTGAARRGIVVIQYRDGLDERILDKLRTLQRAVPNGTIVAPNSTSMPYEVAVTAHRRLLGCARFRDEAIDATRLFRGRYLGSGPESGD